jgi:hypothetical protein
VPEDLSASAWQALMESVDYCPMGIILRLRQLGVSPSRYPSHDVTGGRYPPLEGPISHSTLALRAWVLCGGQPFGELSGGNWMTEQDRVVASLHFPRQSVTLSL